MASVTLGCAPDETHLCLNGNRFRVETNWATTGAAGRGTAVELTDDTGYFWFFDSTNVEVILKVLDGCGVNGHFWVFTAGLTNVQVLLTVTDVVTGTVKQYSNAQNSAYAPIQDTSAFSGCNGTLHAALGSSAAPAPVARAPVRAFRAPSASSAPSPPSACTPGEGVLCLNGERFLVSAMWTTADGKTGDAHAVALTPDTGYFWFFSSSNVELVIKVLDGCSLSHRYWVFAAGMTDVDVTIQVTDAITGQVRSYHNPQHSIFQPIQDTAALATCLPSCDSKKLTVQQVQDAVSSSLAGAADPFGDDFHMILNRFMAGQACDLTSPLGSQRAAPRSLRIKDDFDAAVQYCGPDNSNVHPWLRLLLVSSRLDAACYTHDNCYTSQCNAAGCYFVPGLTTNCDEPLFAACNDLLTRLGCPVVADCVICDIAESIYAIPRSQRQPKCQGPPCSDDPGIACDPSSGRCGGRVITALAREIYNYPLIDSLLPWEFPRGGAYRAQLSGNGLLGARTLATGDPSLSGNVLSAAASEVSLQLVSTPVPECQTSSSSISGVSLSVFGDWSGGISAPAVNIVTGPSPEVERFLITDGTTSLSRGLATQVSFVANILSAGNVQFVYAGCAACQVDWGASTGDQFQTTLRFTVTVTIPSDWGADTWLVEVGAVDGAGQGGVECRAGSGSPATMLIPVLGNPPRAGRSSSHASPSTAGWKLFHFAPNGSAIVPTAEGQYPR